MKYWFHSNNRGWQAASLDNSLDSLVYRNAKQRNNNKIHTLHCNDNPFSTLFRSTTQISNKIVKFLAFKMEIFKHSRYHTQKSRNRIFIVSTIDKTCYNPKNPDNGENILKTYLQFGYYLGIIPFKIGENRIDGTLFLHSTTNFRRFWSQIKNINFWWMLKMFYEISR